GWLCVLRSIGDAVVATDASGRVTFMNPAAEALAGWGHAEAAARPLAEIFHLVDESSRAEVETPVERVLREGRGVDLAHHTLLIRRDGSEAVIDDSASPIVDAQGEITGVVLVLRDVTGQRRIQLEAAERARQAELGAAVGRALVSKEPLQVQLQRVAEAVVTCLDAAFARIWTLQPQENVLELRASAGMYTHLDGPHGRIAVGALKIGWIAQERKPHLTNEAASDPRVSDQAWAKREGMVAFAGYPLTLEDRLVGVLALFARHRLTPAALQVLASVADEIALAIEQKRREQEVAQLVAVVEESADFIGLAHLDGRTFFVNRAGREMVGLNGPDGPDRPVSFIGPKGPDGPGGPNGPSSRDDRHGLERVRGKHLPDYFMPDSLAEVNRIFERALTEGRGSGEVRFRHFATGEALPIWWHLFTLKDPLTGEPLAVATVSRDLREQKRYAAEVERRLEFEQQLLGIVSHDLRNPLNLITLSSRLLLEEGRLDERSTTQVGRIRSSADRATRMIRDLLDFTRARLGVGIPIEPRPLDIHPLIEQGVGEARLAFPHREIALDPQGEGTGIWDADRLAQVLSNLLGNALSYSPAATPVTVRTRGGAESFVLEIHNRGDAIAPDLLPALWRPLNRGAQQSHTSARSIGLGLYIVREIVTLHGGDVGIASTPEAGTTVTVRLPRTPPAAASRKAGGSP
ncbi:MAG: PAS domain S-box protein, partial [Acidobacteriota bacterium]|nr:PAS domain S-box protein [Acidobacteriota bacterium]